MGKTRELDMIHGPLGRGIVRYALPVAFTGILQQLFNAADVAVVGRFVGTEAMAAVGTDSPLVSLIVHFFVGLSLGANVVIATAIGRQAQEEVHRAVHNSVILAIASGFLITAVGEPGIVLLIGRMGVPAEVFSMAVVYMRIYLAGAPVIVLYNFLAAIFRSVGNTRTPLLALIVSGVINVILNVFFVAGLGMTVDGVALATVISNAISAAMLFILLVRTDSEIRFRFRELHTDRAMLARILRIGVPAGVQGMIFSIANIIIQTAINSLGTLVMAGSSAAFNVEVIAYSVLNSFGQACTTFVGQNNGAGSPERCRQSLRDSMLLGLVITMSVCAVLLLFGRQILYLFNTHPDVIDAGYLRLEFILGSYAFSEIQEVLSGYLRGYGVSTLPAVISVAGICGVRIVWVYTVFRAHPTFRMLLSVYPISLILTAAALVAATVLFEARRRKRLEAAR